MTRRVVLRACMTAAAFAVVIAGCGGNDQSKPGGLFGLVGDVLSLPGDVLIGSQPAPTNRRPVEAEPARPKVAAPSVKDFLAACDLMARDLVMSNVVQSAGEPLVVEIRPIENKTDARIDLTIYPQTIRGMIMKSGNNRLVFRDETARRDILAERGNQAGDPVTVDYEETIDQTRSTPNASAPTAKAESAAAKTKVKKSSEVAGRIAATDYFLNGFIYAVTEGDAASKADGLRYFRFQFRLTDARSGLVVWENDYEVKKQGA